MKLTLTMLKRGSLSLPNVKVLDTPGEQIVIDISDEAMADENVLNHPDYDMYQAIKRAQDAGYISVDTETVADMALANGKVFIGNGSGVAVARTVSGAFTLTNAGVATLATANLPVTTAVTDPGNAGAIPVANAGICPIVTAGAETRTLAAPAVTGIILTLAMKTDGGNCVVTCATLVNQAGNNTLTFNDAGDTLVLQAIEVGVDKRWRIIANDGVILSTV